MQFATGSAMVGPPVAQALPEAQFEGVRMLIVDFPLCT
jgi:hypothetical protein